MFFRVHHIDVVNRLLPLARILSQIRDRLAHRHIRTQAGVARVHQPPGFVLRVVEESLHFSPSRVIQQGQQILAFFGRRLLNQVGDIVRRQQSDPKPPLSRGQRQRQLRSISSAQLQEKIIRFLPLQELKTFYLFLHGKHGPRFVEFSRSEVLVYHV